MTRTIRSELLKIRTTKLWWLMGLGILGVTALALLVNLANAHFALQRPHLWFPDDMSQQEKAAQQAQADADYTKAHSAAGLASLAANVYTSGQFLGVLFVMLLGALIVTNEYFHQTATATFLTTPRRTLVIFAKFFTGVLLATFFWLLTTVIDLVGGVIFFQAEHVSNSLGRWDVTRSLLLNLAAYAVWAVLGVALGTLIRSQIGAVVTGTVAYLLSLPATMIFYLIYGNVIKEDWVLTAQVILPAFASLAMTTPGGEAFEHAPPQWVGAAVLIGYGLVAGVIGTLLIRRRDIS